MPANKNSTRGRRVQANAISIDQGISLIQTLNGGKGARVIDPNQPSRNANVKVPSPEYTQAIHAYVGTPFEDRIKAEVEAKTQTYGDRFFVEFTVEETEEAAA